MSSATIIIPQRGKQELTEHLVSELAQFEPGVPVIVVDDGADGPFEARGPIGHAKILPNETPGLTRAWNRGVLATDTDVIILLNNDVRCRGPFVEQLATSVFDHGLVGPELRTDPDLRRDVLSGWCFAFDRLLFNLVGGFNPRMSLYYSDTFFQHCAIEDGGVTPEQIILPLKHLGHQTAHDTKITPNQRRIWKQDRQAFHACMDDWRALQRTRKEERHHEAAQCGEHRQSGRRNRALRD